MFERRREERAQVTWPLQAASLSAVGEGSVVDISLCGVQFTIDCRLRPKEMILLHIVLGEKRSIEVAAQIVRVQGDAGTWTCAADFKFMSPEDRQALSFALLMAHDPDMSNRRNISAA